MPNDTPLIPIMIGFMVAFIGLTLGIWTLTPADFDLSTDMALSATFITVLSLLAWVIILQSAGFTIVSTLFMSAALTWAFYWLTGAFDSMAILQRPEFVIGELREHEGTWYTSLWFKFGVLSLLSLSTFFLVLRER
ncbi:hypothetical protein [Chromohalobacter japonicus]|uniref:hypothetical protein n=1 Tax=Chromohalobacter japonicus TaxID=223900 RepID=UPI001FF14700|nr:hypothetical protein [Chromohalobacter japonicus]MCK0754378.1 hypothetical protein [Chromohalobacter japonicus]